MYYFEDLVSFTERSLTFCQITKKNTHLAGNCSTIVILGDPDAHRRQLHFLFPNSLFSLKLMPFLENEKKEREKPRLKLNSIIYCIPAK